MSSLIEIDVTSRFMVCKNRIKSRSTLYEFQFNTPATHAASEKCGSKLAGTRGKHHCRIINFDP